MAIDNDLSNRFRVLVEGIDGISEQKMMGSNCFLLKGHMIGGANRTPEGDGQFLFRIDKENSTEIQNQYPLRSMMLGTRTMRGFFYIDEDVDDATLRTLLSHSIAYVATLLPKGEKRK